MHETEEVSLKVIAIAKPITSPVMAEDQPPATRQRLAEAQSISSLILF